MKRNCKLILPLLVAVSLLGCSQEQEQAGEPGDIDRSTVEGLRLVALFGAERIDVSEDVDWFGTEIGAVESEVYSQNGDLFSYEWAEEFRSVGVDGVYPIAEGEVGVELTMEKGSRLLGRYQLPPAEGAFQVLEVPLKGIGRVVLDAEGLEDSAFTQVQITGPDIIGRGSGWRNIRGPFYIRTAENEHEITLTNDDTGESHSQRFSLTEGETININFVFSQ